jgi:hypothetical protein
MIPLDYVLAAALLTTPPGPLTADAREAPPEPVEQFITVRPAVQQLALAWEVLDPREVKYVLSRPEDFSGDLRLLRRRCAELADAPPLHDALRFPDRSLVNDLLTFNRTYKQNVDLMLALDRSRAAELQEVLAESERLYQVWDLVRDSRCDYYYITVRRQALKKLRDQLGDEAYYSGALPPHVPVWRFARAN